MSNENNQLKELKGSGYEIADGEPDIINWTVQTSNSEKIGTVADVIFDEESRNVRYLIINVDYNNSETNLKRQVLTPIGLATVHESNDVVIIPFLTQQLAMLPDYKKDRLDIAAENKIRDVLSGIGFSGVALGAISPSQGQGSYYANDLFDESNLFKQRNTRSDIRVPIIEEHLVTDKKLTDTGGVRITSHVVEEPVEQQLDLKEEHVSLTKNVVNKPLTEADFAAFTDVTIELVEHAEVPIVSKEARVVEEISIGKEVKYKDVTVQDTVRKTEVDVEEITIEENRESSNYK